MIPFISLIRDIRAYYIHQDEKLSLIFFVRVSPTALIGIKLLTNDVSRV
jgi:hypothetical protein